MLEAARLTGAVELVLTGCRPRCGGAPTAWLLLVVVRATSVASARGAVVLAAQVRRCSTVVFFASVLQDASTGGRRAEQKRPKRSATQHIYYLCELSIDRTWLRKRGLP